VTPLEAVLGLAMLVGLVGILIPVLPGSLLVWAAVVVWAFAGEQSTAVRVGVAAAATALTGVALVVSTTLPARRARDENASRWAAWIVAAGTIVGFFVVPVVGALLGGPVAIFLAETVRLRDARAGWRSAVRTLRALGAGIAIELAAAVVVIGVWLAAVLG
jgi:uncharacterized protein YqgC (DUF456 family)